MISLGVTPISDLNPCVHARWISRVRLFATPWTAAHQASLSFTVSWSLLKLMSIESVMPSNHLILYCHLLLLPSIFPSVRVFSNESVLKKHTGWHTWGKNEDIITEINARRKTIQSLRENRIRVSERSIIKVQFHVKRKNCFFQFD